MSSLKPYQPKQILFLSNVYLRDCKKVEDIFQESIFSSSIITKEPEYDKIPSIYTGMDTWKKSTNIPCWWCDLQFKDIPVFIPKSIDAPTNLKPQTMRPEGIFSSFHCAQAYINRNYPRLKDKTSLSNQLKLLYKDMKGISIDDILAAPDPKKEMKKYGVGNLTEEEYVLKVKQLDSKFKEDIEMNNCEKICQLEQQCIDLLS
jgi:hypothetical protein